MHMVGWMDIGRWKGKYIQKREKNSNRCSFRTKCWPCRTWSCEHCVDMEEQCTRVMETLCDCCACQKQLHNMVGSGTLKQGQKLAWAAVDNNCKGSGHDQPVMGPSQPWWPIMVIPPTPGHQGPQQTM